MPRLHLVDTEGQQRRLADPEYLRLIVVRHPFDRLISAYRDKIQQEGTARDIIISQFLGYIARCGFR